LRHAQRRGWVRAFNKIIELTEQAGLPTPEFESYTGEFLIRFRLGKGALKTRQAGAGAESQPESQPESLVMRIIYLLRDQRLSKSQISTFLGQKMVSGHLRIVIKHLIQNGMIEYTIPDKPNSRLQKYRITSAGLAELMRFQQQ
jgi:predicted HTH transcriptional regulator